MRVSKNSALIAIIFILAVTCLMFFKIFTRGLYPIPADLLVSFYYPWYSGAWEGYDPWTTHKELLGADAIRQIYPWKEFAMEQIKRGKIPLWNPYTFSGQPLLANFQSSVFYPANIFYFLTDPRNAWILLIVTQPFLGAVFMYLAARSFNLSAISSIFAAVAFIFSSYFVTWMENGNVTHSYLWFPLSFWAINIFFAKLKTRFLLVLVLSLSFSTLAGHPQTAIYHNLTVLLYWLFKSTKSKFFSKLLILAAVFFASLATVAIQLVPTYDFYTKSPISLPFSREVFDRSILPYKNLISFFASDFFGHPAAGNFWSQSYGDFTPYFGVVPLVFSLWAIARFWNQKLIAFMAAVSVFFILSAVPGPITYLIKTLRVPLLDSTTPSRFISISIFFLAILSAVGFDDLLKNLKDKKYLNSLLKFLMSLGLIYVGLWAFAILGVFFLEPKETWQINLAVTRRNLILPTLMFLSIPVGLQLLQIIRGKIKISDALQKALLVLGIFTVTLVGGVYYSNKFLPVAPKKFIFPDHLVFKWLQDNLKLKRFYGGGTAHIDFNFPTHYKVYGAEGYDSLRLERYAQLLASSFTGSVPQSYLRSDGVFPNEENGRRKRLFEILGVSHFVDKEDNPKTGADWHYERFSGDAIEGIYQLGKFQFYKREPALPRVFLTTKYTVAQDDGEIIQKIYDPNFDLKTLILEKEPSLAISDIAPMAVPEVAIYEPNVVTIKTNAQYNSLLYLSDTHDPDWNVEIDGQKSELLRAHYAMRAVAVPAGARTVGFQYQPKSFTRGLIISTFSLIALSIISIYFIHKRKF